MVGALEEENINETQINDRVVTLKDLHAEIQELKALIKEQNQHKPDKD